MQNELLSGVASLLTKGDFDTAAERLEDLELLFAAPDVVTRHEARVLVSMILLPRMRITEVRDAWKDYATTRSRTILRKNGVSLIEERLEKHDCLRGLVLVELGNLCFRLFSPGEGARLTSAGLDLLKDRSDAPTADIHFIELAQIHALIWSARLDWVEGHSSEALTKVDQAIHSVALHRRGHGLDSGLDLAEAIALDLSAEFLAIQGDTQRALEFVRRALVLVGSANDSTRLAHIYYLYGKLESPAAHEGEPAWPRRLFRRAYDVYPDGHAFCYRAANQEVQLLVRLGELTPASLLLDQQEARLRRDSSIARPERTYVKTDFALTRSWILERTAGLNPKVWQDCYEHSSRMYEQARRTNLPRRFQAEICLHHGRALTARGLIDDALTVLQEGLAAAQHASTKIAIRFAMAEAHLRRPDCESARACWRTGRDELEGIRSHFLDRWADQLAHHFREVRVNADLKFPEAERRFRTDFISLHLETVDDRGIKGLAEDTGVPEPTLRDWCAKYGLMERAREKGLFPGRTGPRKRV